MGKASIDLKNIKDQIRDSDQKQRKTSAKKTNNKKK